MPLPSEPRLRWMLRTCARLYAGGTEPVSGLVLPNGKYFPDDFDRTPAALERLLRRVQRHVGLDDIDVRLAVAADPSATAAGGCSSGACAPALPGKLGRVRREGGAYSVAIVPGEASHATVLTTVLARALSHVFLLEAELYDEFDPLEAEQVLDVAGVMLGLGVLLSNGAYIYSKGCGGVRVGSATLLPVDEIALALAIFCKLHHVPSRTAAHELDPTARAAFAEALSWADSNGAVVALVESDPAVIEADGYSLSQARGWLSRMLGVGRARGATVPDDAELERVTRDLRSRAPRDDVKARRLARLSKLVDEAFEAED